MELEFSTNGIGIIDRDHETDMTDVTFLDDRAERMLCVLFLELMRLLVGKVQLEPAMGASSQNRWFGFSK